jgi:hypothetical protein
MNRTITIHPNIANVLETAEDLGWHNYTKDLDADAFEQVADEAEAQAIQFMESLGLSINFDNGVTPA